MVFWFDKAKDLTKIVIMGNLDLWLFILCRDVLERKVGMDSESRLDWREVVDLHPGGYVELQKDETIIHGPIESVTIDDTDFVVITLKWAAKMGAMGTPTFGKWKTSPEDTKIRFPNLLVPFAFQDVPKGKRVLFAGMNILYIDPVKGVDPNSVEGLVI